MLTDRDICILVSICKYYVLSRPQIQRLCFPTDKTGRVTRRRIQQLVSSGMINRHKAQVIYPNSSPAGSVYYPAEKGREFAFEHTGNQEYLLTPTRCPQPHHVLHWVAVSDTHIKLNQAIASQSSVQACNWINEWDTVNKDETDHSKHFQLHTVLKDNPRLICAPDSAFMLKTTVNDHEYSKVFYLEQDRGTTGVRQVAARKIKGYAELAKQTRHKSHFPETNVDAFTVLCVTSTPRRRDALIRAFSGLDRAEFWKFCAVQELTPESFLFTPIWYSVDGSSVPLVKPTSSSKVNE